MVFTYTGVVDEITALRTEDSYIEVTFKIHGTYKINWIENNKNFNVLKQMEVGHEVLIATRYGSLMWVKTL